MVAFFYTLCRLGGVLCLCSLLLACGSQSKKTDQGALLKLPAVAGEPDFNWRLSGDRRIAPKQVFSDQQRIWLQWPHRQSLPTIFGRVDQTWEVLHPQKVGAYVLISGVWTALKFQGGEVKALAQKIGFEPVPQQIIEPYASRERAHSALTQHAHTLTPSHDVGATSLLTPPQPTVAKFTAQLNDKTIRQAIKRWAKQTPWHFENVHWAVGVDLPILGAASFTDDFVTSVQQLLNTTEMSDKPVQPCFYTNHVVRIVPIAQVCDPQAHRGSAA
jgi:hypothetical protein